MHRPALIVIAAALTGLAACSSDSSWRASDKETAPAISVSATNTSVAVGDTTTLTVKSRNTLGQNAHVEWTTTGGRITPEENGRIARAQFPTPGAYTVTATLYVDNKVTAQDSATINVKPVH
jgi:hypothetical protein